MTEYSFIKALRTTSSNKDIEQKNVRYKYR